MIHLSIIAQRGVSVVGGGCKPSLQGLPLICASARAIIDGCAFHSDLTKEPQLMIHRLLALSLLFMSLLMAAPAHAGWVLTSDSGEVTTIAGGAVRVDAQDSWFVYRAEENSLLLVAPEHKVYSQTSPKGFCSALQRLIKQNTPPRAPEEQALIDALRANPDMKMTLGIRLHGPGDKVAGIDTMRYFITAGQQDVGRILIATDAPFIKEAGGAGRFNATVNEMQECLDSDAIKVEFSKEYLDIMSKGWVMRMEGTDGANPSGLAKVEERALPEGLFVPPVGFGPLPIEAFLIMTSGHATEEEVVKEPAVGQEK